jgi:hypothetical protein
MSWVSLKSILDSVNHQTQGEIQMLVYSLKNMLFADVEDERDVTKKHQLYSEVTNYQNWLICQVHVASKSAKDDVSDDLGV